MESGTWSADENGVMIVDADNSRGEVTIQRYTGDEAYVGFGEMPTVGEGLRLSSGFQVISINDYRAQLPIYLKCAGTKSASGGYQTA